MEATIKAYDLVLSVAGISIFAKQNWKSKTWLTFQILTILSISSAIIFSFAFAVSCLPDLHASIESAVVAFTFFISSITLIMYLVHKRNFQNFLDEMVFNDPALENPFIKHVLSAPHIGDKTKEFQLLIISSQERLLRWSRIFVKSYACCVAFTVTMYMFGPMYTTRAGTHSARILPLDMKFPWSTNNIIIYILTFLFQVHAGYLCSIGFPCFISLLILLVLQIRRQLNLLSFILVNLNEMMLEKTERQEDWAVACSLVVSLCIDHYLKTKRFTSRLNDVCKPFFVGIVLTAMSLEGVCFVKIAIIQQITVDMMKYCMHLSLLMLGMSIFSFLGQMIDDACAELEESVLEKWYIFNQKHQKLLLIFHFALAQRMPLYIYGSVTLTFETFTWFVKTGMSFFTLMMSVLEK